ncbi:hypothetical protein OsJ_34142 [Oryza sativa Japonica Group]|uniref:Uncharacterized protein n=1 Tax=Oryza sativa subsp. japonica TaxID=39947 RepID=A3CC07_ORYSJ|nr:hypothetical protein OsJ_34142 [Oryza sativa Japonica Group]
MEHGGDEVLWDGASGVEEADITASAIAAGGGVGGVEEEIVKLLVRCFYSYVGFFPGIYFLY